MTYCVAVSVDAGIVFCSDSRTNAGVDQVSTYSKMYRFETEGDGGRQFVVLSAGNLATTQATIAQLKRDIREQTAVNLMTVNTMSDAADYLGEISVKQQEKHKGGGFEATFILGGQIPGSEHRIVLIYPEGNHITSSKDTPFLQIGESKYGKPILDRIITKETDIETAAKCVLVSMDSTMQSNLSVGPPIELLIYGSNSFKIGPYHRFEEGSEYLRNLKQNWDRGLKRAFQELAPVTWATTWDNQEPPMPGSTLNN